MRTGLRCEFTGTAKKRGPRNGTVEVIKSPARRIENVLKKDPSLKDAIDNLLAKNNFRSTVSLARPPSIIPSDAPIVIIDDDTGITTDASQSHGIPRPLIINNGSGNFSRQRRHVTNVYPRDGSTQEFETTNQSPVLRRPVPLYPQIPRNEHHFYPYARRSNSSNTEIIPSLTLPSISSFGAIFPENSSIHGSSPGIMSEALPPLTETLTLPSPWTGLPRKSMSMSFGSTGKQVLLPPAPDVGNPLNPKSTSHDFKPLEIVKDDNHVDKKFKFNTNNLPSPPTTNLLSPKLTASLLSPLSSPKSYPTDFYRSIQPKIDLLSQPVSWCNNNDMDFSPYRI
ncbi:7815_t:CDS:2 [Diversispora eburnea]|uniref:7815_t:CDS:1 n=1 Tax=Diversispora eburnea TaxID=1213867 RepID=A0A9N9AZR9_9GLOM|nr:7815_t:CDS:2 [Diversispora eburnea]